MLIEPNIGRHKACTAKKFTSNKLRCNLGLALFFDMMEKLPNDPLTKEAIQHIIKVFRALNDYYKLAVHEEWQSFSTLRAQMSLAKKSSQK